MSLPVSTATIDQSTGYALPRNIGTWGNLVAWDSWKTWNNQRANSMIVVGTITDREKTGYFNLKTTADVTGNIAYSVYTSNSGAFSGEETVSNITPNSSNIAAFYGRFYTVVANVTDPSGAIELRSLNVTSVDSKFDLELDDIVLGTLSGNINHRILPLSRPVSAITNIQVTPHYESADYVQDGYIQTYSVGTYTTLKTNGGINANSTLMAVASIDNFQNSRHLIVMDDEVMAYTGKSAGTPWPTLNSLERGLSEAPEFGATIATGHIIETEVQLYDTITFNAPYFTNEATIGTPFVISKDRQAPAITLKSNAGVSVGGTVDARISVLPEQYMDNTNLNTR